MPPSRSASVDCGGRIKHANSCTHDRLFTPQYVVADIPYTSNTMCQGEPVNPKSLTNGHVKSKTKYEVDYCPTLVLEHPDFRVLEHNDPALDDGELNLACAYDENHLIKMIVKPKPVAREGEAIVRVRATGICG